MTPNRVMSGGAHLPAKRQGNAGLKERRSVGDTVSDLTDPELKPQTSRNESNVLTTELNG